jgi:hypothetical protein
MVDGRTHYEHCAAAVANHPLCDRASGHALAGLALVRPHDHGIYTQIVGHLDDHRTGLSGRLVCDDAHSCRNGVHTRQACL